MVQQDVRAIDHVGLTVPDVDAAQKYFADVFGAVFVYSVLPKPVSGPSVEEALGLRRGAVLDEIRLLRLGDGANIELFSYRTESQMQPVIASDFGLQHFAIYVDDLEAVISRIEANGGAVLGHIDVLPGGDAGSGNRYIYTRTPWGSLIELMHVPSPQAYETGTFVRRWKPGIAAA